MRISQLIDQLNTIKAKEGDLPVVVDNDDPDNYCMFDGLSVVNVDKDDWTAKHDLDAGNTPVHALCIDLF